MAMINRPEEQEPSSRPQTQEPREVLVLQRSGQVDSQGLPIFQQLNSVARSPGLMSSEQQIELSLGCLKYFDGLHLIWRLSKEGLEKKLIPIYFGMPESDVEHLAFTFTRVSDASCPITCCCCFDTTPDSERITFYQNGAEVKFTADLPRLSTWWCNESRNRIMEVFVPRNSAAVGSIMIPRFVGDGANIENKLSGRSLIASKVKTEGKEPALQVHDEGAGLVAEAVATAGTKITSYTNGIKTGSENHWHEFKMIFHPGSCLTVTDKLLLVVLMKAWVVDMRVKDSQYSCMKCMLSMLCFAIVVVFVIFYRSYN